MKSSGDYLSKLLLTRLKRSLFRTKARVITVMILITLSSYAGVSFAEYNRNMKSVYIDFYAETNLADLIISDSEQPEENFSRICQEYEDWLCESRLKLSGQTQFTNDTGTHWISSVWYGITSNEVSRLYMIEGELAEKKNEVVIDAHFADAHELVIGDTLTIGAGFGMHEVNISGIANNPLHLWYSPEGSLFPDAANFVVGYFDASYLAEISGFDSDVRNELHIDLPGTPNFDISSTTDIDEGEALNPIKEQLSKGLADNEMSGVIVDRSGMSSPELLRVDLEGSQKSTPFILAILLLISGLVIAVSIDRLVKSQSREIAVLRTVGASSKQIMSGYLLVPLVLGIPSVILGIILALTPYGSKGLISFYVSFFGIPVVKYAHHADIIASVGFGSILLIFLFGIRPAFRAANLQPMDVLGQSSSKTPSSWLISLTKRLPPGIGLGIRSTFRKPGRLFLTLLALALSMVILGGVMMMQAVFTDVFEETYDKQVNWDAEVYFWDYQFNNVSQWSESNADSHEFVIKDEASMRDDSRLFYLEGMDSITTDDSSTFRVNLVSGSIPLKGMNPPQVLVDKGMLNILELSVGEEITISRGGDIHVVEISGVSQEIERKITFHRTDLSAIVGYDANTVRLKFSQNQSVDEELRNISLMTVEKQTAIDGLSSVIDMQQNALQSIMVIGGLMAVAILFNTLLMNLAERDTELATLRVLGASRSKLSLILTVEHAFIGLIGGITGFLASMGMLTALSSLLSTWEFYIPVQADPYVSFQIIGFVLFAALLTTPLGIWRIGKMNLLEVVSRHER